MTRIGMKDDWAVKMQPIVHGWLQTYERWIGRRSSRHVYRHLVLMTDPLDREAERQLVLRIRMRWDLCRVHRSDAKVWSNYDLRWTRVSSSPARTVPLVGGNGGRAMVTTLGTNEYGQLNVVADAIYRCFVVQEEKDLLQTAAHVLFGPDAELPFDPSGDLS